MRLKQIGVIIETLGAIMFLAAVVVILAVILVSILAH